MASTELAAAESAHEAANQLKLNYETRLNQFHLVGLVANAKYIEACHGIKMEPTQARDLIESDPLMRQQLQTALATLDQQLHTATQLLRAAEASLASTLAVCNGLALVVELTAARDAADLARTQALQRIGIEQQILTQDDQQRNNHAALRIQVESARDTHDTWQEVNAAIGSAAGDKFRKFVQSLTLDHLVHLANHHLTTFSQRYSLIRTGTQDLGLQIRDREMADAIRPVATLSGGERFLISLGLALALSSLEGNDSFVDCLFIDEGFGSLDAESLDLVMLALETLPGSGRRVGVITHVAAMMDRIAVQVRVNKQGNGRSSIKIVDASLDNWALFAATMNPSSPA